jgi:hypothetical protein
MLTVRVVAGRLRVSTATVHKLFAGATSAYPVSNAIRVAPADLDASLARYRGQAGGRKERP